MSITDKQIREFAKANKIYTRECTSVPLAHGGWVHPFAITLNGDTIRKLFLESGQGELLGQVYDYMLDLTPEEGSYEFDNTMEERYFLIGFHMARQKLMDYIEALNKGEQGELN